ncbi:MULTISPECIES: hypothetical protein [unclassified Roseibium]|uniref:hypothetical protein n=1 Tax=unclassified Roseibium TaxID=2629323 RepID=UPI00273DD432|nr:MULTISPECIES: hypothetical protein [unclassified Roseibium]
MNQEEKQYVIAHDNGPDLRFIGERIATAESNPESQHPNYSGERGRWEELELYKTSGGSFVCLIEERSQWIGERPVRRAKVVRDVASIIDYFGQGWLAKELYEAASIENVQEIT